MKRIESLKVLVFGNINELKLKKKRKMVLDIYSYPPIFKLGSPNKIHC